MRALLIIAGLVVVFLAAAGIIALFANWSDKSMLNAKRNKKQVQHYRLLLAQIEDECTAQLQVSQYDLTAHRVKDLIIKTQRHLGAR